MPLQAIEDNALAWPAALCKQAQHGAFAFSCDTLLQGLLRASHAFYDVAEYFASCQWSDLTLVLTVGAEDEGEQEEPPAKRQRCTEQDALGGDAVAAQHVEELLPGHSLVLAGCSPVFKAELTRWQQQEGEQHNDKPRITLRVDSTAELEAARTMVQFMYQQHLPEGASQPLLRTLLQLADRFQVQTCTAACAAALSAQELSAETLEQVLPPPPVHCNSPLFNGVFKRASDQLQQQFGDLEAAWADESARERLLALPLKGMELLLGDERTRVAHENTALRLAALWVDEDRESVTAEDTNRLAQLIRCPCLTPFFAATIAMKLPLLVDALSAATVAIAPAVAQATRGMSRAQ